MPYVCEGTIIRTNNNREGSIVAVDRTKKIIVAYTGKTFFTEKLENVIVVSYKGVY